MYCNNFFSGKIKKFCNNLNLIIKNINICFLKTIKSNFTKKPFNHGKIILNDDGKEI